MRDGISSVLELVLRLNSLYSEGRATDIRNVDMQDWEECAYHMNMIAQEWERMRDCVLQRLANVSVDPAGVPGVTIVANPLPDHFHNKTMAFWLALQHYGRRGNYDFSREQLKRLERLYCYYRDDTIYEIERKFRVPSRYFAFSLDDALKSNDAYGRPITSRGMFIE